MISMRPGYSGRWFSAIFDLVSAPSVCMDALGGVFVSKTNPDRIVRTNRREVDRAGLLPSLISFGRISIAGGGGERCCSRALNRKRMAFRSNSHSCSRFLLQMMALRW